MIHIAIGTKAQFIKMAPVMHELKRRSVIFNLIDLGQHSLITNNLRKEFEIKMPDICLSAGTNISHLFRGIMWTMQLITKGFDTGWVNREVFLDNKGICLIHGDTASTLLALYFAKRVKLKVAHIEAGLRSYSYTEPFPEELVRVIAMSLSDVLFAPSSWAFNNLRKMGLDKKAVFIDGNTSYESTLYSLNKRVELNLDFDKFSVVTVHRMENIFVRRRLKFVIDLVAKISNKIPVVFVQHPPTINQINKFRFLDDLRKIRNIRFFKILSHAHFVHLLDKCSFIVTDGGSIQEESYYLNKPCLLLRHRTERREGLGENVILSKFCLPEIDYFLGHYSEFRRKEPLRFNKPSAKIVDYLIENNYTS